jgi:hypothetical protein
MDEIPLHDAMTLNLSGWRVREKMEGVLAERRGDLLVSRTGKAIKAPSKFIAEIPEGVLGELWAGRGRLDVVQSALRTGDFSAITFCPHDENQHEIESSDALAAFYDRVILDGGQGVVITSPEGYMFKIKPRTTAKAVVVESGFEMSVVEFNGVKFKLPCGQWPYIGTVVRFSFCGQTRKGTPKAARFISDRLSELNCERRGASIPISAVSPPLPPAQESP